MVLHTAKDKPYHHGNLRQALLSAAEYFLSHEPIEKLSLRALARHVGVSQTAPYRHFSSKNGLLVALAEDGFTFLIQSSLQITACHSTDVLRSLELIFHNYIHFAKQHPYKYQLMFGGLIHDPELIDALRHHYEKAYQIIEVVCAQGVADGVFFGNVVVLTNTYWSLLHGLVSLYFDGIVGVGDSLDMQSQRSLALLLSGFSHAA